MIVLSDDHFLICCKSFPNGFQAKTLEEKIKSTFNTELRLNNIRKRIRRFCREGKLIEHIGLNSEGIYRLFFHSSCVPPGFSLNDPMMAHIQNYEQIMVFIKTQFKHTEKVIEADLFNPIYNMNKLMWLLNQLERDGALFKTVEYVPDPKYVWLKIQPINDWQMSACDRGIFALIDLPNLINSINHFEANQKNQVYSVDTFGKASPGEIIFVLEKYLTSRVNFSLAQVFTTPYYLYRPVNNVLMADKRFRVTECRTRKNSFSPLFEDIDIQIDALLSSLNDSDFYYEELFLVSGDNRFVPALKEQIKEGRNVTVLAHVTSLHHTYQDLLQVAKTPNQVKLLTFNIMDIRKEMLLPK